MNEHLKQSLEEVGKAYIKELTNQLLKAGKNSTGSLIDSLDFQVVKTLDQFTVAILAEDYLKQVDEGRKPGKQPPVKEIAKWVRKKGIRFKELDVNSTAFIIARSIGKKGIKKTDVINKTKQRVLDNISEILAAAAMEDIEVLIDTMLKDIK